MRSQGINRPGSLIHDKESATYPYIDLCFFANTIHTL
jgi:hypothetical protein